MAYTKKKWVNVPNPSNPPSIPEGQDALARFDADNMNRIEDGVEAARVHIDDDIRHIEPEERTEWDSKAPGGHGLGDISAGTNALTYIDVISKGCGFYQLGDEDQSPHGTSEWTGLIQVIRGKNKGAEAGSQLAFYDFTYNDPKMWLRSMVSGKMGKWVEMIHTGNAVDRLSNLGMVKIANGSHIGTGTYGEKNPTIIPVPFKPKVLFVKIGKSQEMERAYYCDNLTEVYTGSGFGTYWKYANKCIYVYTLGSISGQTPDFSQLNVAGTTYEWLIIG